MTKMTDDDIAYWKQAVEVQNLRKTLPPEAFKEVDQQVEEIQDDFLTNFDKKKQEIDDKQNHAMVSIDNT